MQKLPSEPMGRVSLARVSRECGILRVSEKGSQLKQKAQVEGGIGQRSYIAEMVVGEVTVMLMVDPTTRWGYWFSFVSLSILKKAKVSPSSLHFIEMFLDYDSLIQHIGQLQSKTCSHRTYHLVGAEWKGFEITIQTNMWYSPGEGWK